MEVSFKVSLALPVLWHGGIFSDFFKEFLAFDFREGGYNEENSKGSMLLSWYSQGADNREKMRIGKLRE